MKQPVEATSESGVSLSRRKFLQSTAVLPAFAAVGFPRSTRFDYEAAACHGAQGSTMKQLACHGALGSTMKQLVSHGALDLRLQLLACHGALGTTW